MKTVIKEFAIAAAVSFIIMQFIRPVNVMGNSMEPTLSSGDRAFVSRVAYKRISPERGDIAVSYTHLDVYKRQVSVWCEEDFSSKA